jgi:hypothetical protein
MNMKPLLEPPAVGPPPDVRIGVDDGGGTLLIAHHLVERGAVGGFGLRAQ